MKAKNTIRVVWVFCVLMCLAEFTVVAQAQNAPQNTPDAVKALEGAWEISNSDRDRICIVTFRTDAEKGGYKLDFDKNCADTFAATKDVQAWTLSNDALRLIDARGQTLLNFSEVENGMYEAERPGESIYFMQSAAAAAAAPAFQTADQMFGDWTVSRASNAPLCNVTLTKTARGDDGFALQIKQPCEALVTGFNPIFWRMDMGELVLTSPRGDSWRFAEGEAGSWRRVPESAEPLVLTRK